MVARQGAFIGIDMNDKDRLVVLMNLLSRLVKVQIAARMVVPA